MRKSNLVLIFSFFAVTISIFLNPINIINQVTVDGTLHGPNAEKYEYLSDHPVGSYCSLNIFSKTFSQSKGGGSESCFVVNSEKDNLIARDEIRYRKLGEVKTINLKSADEAKSKHADYIDNNYYILDLDVYKVRETIFYKMIYAQHSSDQKEDSILILNLNSIELMIQLSTNKGYKLVNIETVADESGQIKYSGVLKKSISSELGSLSARPKFKYRSRDPYSVFRRSFNEFSKLGYMLVDVETFEESGLWYFAHVWKLNSGRGAKSWRFYHHVSQSNISTVIRKMNEWNLRPIDIDFYSYKGSDGKQQNRYNLIFSQNSEHDDMGNHRRWYHFSSENNPLMRNGEITGESAFEHMVMAKEGNIPLLIMGPHAGTKIIEKMSKRKSIESSDDDNSYAPVELEKIKDICTGTNSHNSGDGDTRTGIVIEEIIESFSKECKGKRPYMVYTNLYRSVADMNRLLSSFREKPVFENKMEITEGYYDNVCAFDKKEAYFPYQAYHDQVELFVEEIDHNFDISKAMAIDIHGTSVINEDVRVALGYGEATRESRHTMSFELMRSNSELTYDSNGKITNDVINLPFLYGRSGFVNNLNELFGGIGAFPEGHVGENTGYNYADSNKKSNGSVLNGGFWPRYLSHTDSNGIAKPNAPKIDSFQIEIMYKERESDSKAKSIGNSIGKALCQTWKSQRE